MEGVEQFGKAGRVRIVRCVSDCRDRFRGQEIGSLAVGLAHLFHSRPPIFCSEPSSAAFRLIPTIRLDSQAELRQFDYMIMLNCCR